MLLGLLRIDRMSIPSVDFAQRMHAVLAPHLPEFPYPAWAKRPAGAAPSARRPAHSLNSNIRVYKYTQGQYFGPHYDDAVRDTETGAKSEWTLLVYLTGSQDGVEGGEVSGMIFSFRMLGVAPTAFVDYILPRAQGEADRGDRPSADPWNGALAPVCTTASASGACLTRMLAMVRIAWCTKALRSRKAPSMSCDQT